MWSSATLHSRRKAAQPERGPDYVNNSETIPEIPAWPTTVSIVLARTQPSATLHPGPSRARAAPGLVGTQNIRKQPIPYRRLDYVVKTGIIVESRRKPTWSGEPMSMSPSPTGSK